jgi:hypothetical protein
MLYKKLLDMTNGFITSELDTMLLEDGSGTCMGGACIGQPETDIKVRGPAVTEAQYQQHNGNKEYTSELIGSDQRLECWQPGQWQHPCRAVAKRVSTCSCALRRWSTMYW